MNAEHVLAELKAWLCSYTRNPGSGFVRVLDKIAELEAAEEKVCGWCCDFGENYCQEPGLYTCSNFGYDKDRRPDTPACGPTFTDCRQSKRRKGEKHLCSQSKADPNYQCPTCPHGRPHVPVRGCDMKKVKCGARARRIPAVICKSWPVEKAERGVVG